MYYGIDSYCNSTRRKLIINRKMIQSSRSMVKKKIMIEVLKIDKHEQKELREK